MFAMDYEQPSSAPYVKFYNGEEEETLVEPPTPNSSQGNSENVEISLTNSRPPGDSKETQFRAMWYLVTFTLWLGFFVVYGGRFNIYVAVAMHHLHPYITEKYKYMFNSRMDDNITTTESSTTYDENTSNKTEVFDISKEIIGVYCVLAYHVGSMLSGIPAGYMAFRFSALRIFFLGAAVSCFMNIFYPAIIDSFGALLFLNVMQGLAEGAILPSFFGIWSNWVNPKERNIIIPLTFTGTFAGLLTASEFCRQTVESWTAGYSLFGLLSFLWCVLWICVHEIPMCYGDNIIKEPLQDAFKENIQVPWKPIMSSLPVWAIIMANIAYQFIFQFGFHTESFHHSLIAYHLVNEEDMTESAILLFLWHYILPFSLAIFITGTTVALFYYLIFRRNFSIFLIRKIYTCSGFFFGTINFVVSVFILSLSNVISPLATALPLLGFFLNPFDIGPKYASIIIGISNTIAIFFGILVPLIILIVMFYRMFFHLVVFTVIPPLIPLISGIFYFIFAKVDIQPWA